MSDKISIRNLFSWYLELRIILKVIFLPCLIIASVPPAFAQNSKGLTQIVMPEGQSGDIHALIIGISQYATYPSLAYADRDAVAFYQLLLSDAFGADSHKVTLLLNEQATQNRIDEALSNLLNFVKEGDRVFVHFSGHGGVEGLTTSKRGFLLTHETSEHNMRLTSYRIDDLNVILGELATANKADVYLVIDACHAGKVSEARHKGLSYVNEYIGRISYGTSFLSCSPDELSLEGTQWGLGRGLFSYYLIKGLAGEADMDANGSIDLNEISFYVKSKVPKAAAPGKQNPVISGNERVISIAAPTLLDQLNEIPLSVAQYSVSDINHKGYDKFYIDNLTSGQKILYEKFIAATSSYKDKTAKLAIQFADAKKTFEQLVKSGIPVELEGILLRKLIAALQDRPQQLLDQFMSGERVYSDKFETCLLAMNLHTSAQLMGKDHPMFPITMAKVYFFQSQCYRFDKNYKEDASLKHMIISKLDSAILYAEDIDFLYNEKGITLYDLKRYEDAVAMYDRAITLRPDLASYHYNIGLAFRQLKNYDKAVSAFDMAIKFAPENANYYFNKGLALRHMEKYLEAITEFNYALKYNPEHVQAYNNKGLALGKLNRHGESLIMFDKVIALYPNDAMGYRNKAMSLVSLKRYDEAIALVEQCMKIDPENQVIYLYNLGCIYSTRGDKDSALTYLEKALNAGYNDFEWIGKDPDWDNIRSSIEFKTLIRKHSDRKN